MSTREMIIWLSGISAVLAVVGIVAYASIQNTKARTEATVAKAQEHTKRAEGRHQLLDLLGSLKATKALRDETSR